MRALVKLALSLALLLGLVSTASAVQTGTPAWTIVPLTLFEGPGKAYNITGDVGASERVFVDRCSRDWCQIRARHQRGWVSLFALSFGQSSTPWPFARLNLKGGGPGLVCLYEGRNFTGEAMCAESGFFSKDLLLLNRDNRFSSVTIEGDVSVLLCRDRDFKSYCVRVNETTPRLHGFLDNNVTSVKVY